MRDTDMRPLMLAPEPAMHPECAHYSIRACRMLSGQMTHHRASTPLLDVPGVVHYGDPAGTRPGRPADTWHLAWVRSYQPVIDPSYQPAGRADPARTPTPRPGDQSGTDHSGLRDARSRAATGHKSTRAGTPAPKKGGPPTWGPPQPSSDPGRLVWTTSRPGFSRKERTPVSPYLTMIAISGMALAMGRLFAEPTIRRLRTQLADTT